MDGTELLGVSAGHAGRYLACALTVALAATGAGLTIAIFNCLMLMVYDP